MTPKIETSIWLAIRSHIETLPLSYPVAWPAEVFDIPNTVTQLDPYIRVGRVQVEPLRLFIESGKRHDRTGSVIITLVYPIRPDTPVSMYDEIAGTIADHFSDGTAMTYGGICVSVPSYPHVQEGFEDNGYWTVPVNIPWRCFA